MSNVTRIPDPPQLKVLGCFLSQLPPMIARKEVKYFTGGAISPKSVSNDDYLGNGPKFRMKMGDAVVYPTAFFLAYLEAEAGFRAAGQPFGGKGPAIVRQHIFGDAPAAEQVGEKRTHQSQKEQRHDEALNDLKQESHFSLSA